MFHGNFFKIFTFPVWIVMFFVLVFFGVTINKICKTVSNHEESICYKTVTACFINIWAIILGVSVSEMPRTLRVRVFFFLWVCYSLIITTVFQAFFTSFLIEPGIETGITTLEQLNRAKVKLFSLPYEYFQWCIYPEMYYTCSIIKSACSNELECLKKIKNSKNGSILSSNFHMDFTKREYNLCPLEDSQIKIQYVFMMARPSLVFSRINEMVLKMIEYGIIDKIKDDYSRETYGNFLLRKSQKTTDDFFVFTMLHLQIVFYIFGCGLIAGFIVLIGELVYHSLQ
ncbi:hypothetical protein L9F63_022076 [Diploptera punctata]|uniref:Ionotropic glutamate receptor C-terminal domain-containing protein n=1 Tax=Diploptera punctata TaxID=6984 RepID=A0AAD7ZMT7_DIPPU|nr:hypothetical protein L9F63_022076 [Diploptera punctata]